MSRRRGWFLAGQARVRHIGLGVAVCLTALTPPHVVAAQDTAPPPHPPTPLYVERVWHTDDGLPHNIVWTVMQARDGYLWLGTHSGLARFDGVTFTTFSPDEEPDLGGRAVLSLLEDRAGTLWIGTHGAGLFRYRSGEFERLGGERNAFGAVVRALVEDHDGVVWIGSETGLHSVDSQGVGSTHLGADALGGDAVSALAVDPSGALWIGTWEGGLLRLRDGELSRRTTAEGLASNSIRALAVAPDGALWLATFGGGLDRVSGDGRVRNYRVHRSGGRHARAVYVDASGTVWGGTHAGAVHMIDDGAGAAGIDHVVGRRITSITEDHQGNYWLSTYNDGLVKLGRDVVDVLDTRHGLRDANVRAVLEDDSGLWIATDQGGLHRLRDGRMEVFTTADGLLSDTVFALHRDPSGVLWAGTMHGLNRFDGRGFVGLPDDRLRGAIVLAIHRDAEGTVWVGTEGAGLNLYSDEAFRPADDARLASITIRSLSTGPDGALWIGTEARGLFRYRDGVFTAFPAGRGPGSSIRGLYTDAKGALWIGTFSEGFSRWKEGEMTRYGVSNGLADNQVYQFLEDEAGRIWMSSDSGLFYTHVRQVEAAAGAAGTIDASGGIQATGTIASEWFGRPREYNGASQPAAWRARDGRLLFASRAGLVIVDPQRLAIDRAAPPVRIERILVGDRSLSADGGEVRLGPADRVSFEIQYSGLSFINSQRIRFRYKLAGLEDDWVDAATRRTAYYSYVPPGRYKFTVLAANSDGVWNREGASLTLVVLPPFYRTWWFLSCMVLAALVVVVLAYRSRVAHLRARAVLLESVVAERTRDLRREQQETEKALAQVSRQAQKLRELDNAKSRFFTNLSHELRTPLTLIIGPAEQALGRLSGGETRGLGQPLRSIRGNAERLLDLVNQILALSRLEAGYQELQARSGDLARFCREVLTRFAPLAAQGRIELQGPPPGLLCAAAFDHDAVDKILANLLSNALRHAPPGTAVHLALRRVTGGVVLTVSDQGPGIPPERLDRVFDRFYTASHEGSGSGIGLALARELAHLHGGDLSVDSQPIRGSTFKLVLPLEVESWQSDVEAAAAAQADIALSPSPGLGRRGQDGDRTTVLVVEDEPEVCQFVEGCLEGRYQVLTAEDGRAGLERARRELPDLIVSDIMMPRLDGTAMVRTLAADPATRAIPVIVLTARSEQAQELEGLEAGAVDYLTKPFAPEILLARVERMLGFARRLREQLRMELAAETEDGGAPRAESPVERIERAIRRHLTDPDLDVERLAREANTSRSHLKRLLADAGLPPPSVLIRERRLDEAARLLARGRGTVTEVAYATGFQALSNFARRFRERFGESPSDYLASRGHT